MVVTYNDIATNLTKIIRKKYYFTLKGNAMTLISWSDWQLIC